MNKTREIGSDVGNDALKIILDQPNYEGKTKIEVMNVVAQGYKRRIMGTEKGHPANLLDVTITSEGKAIGSGRYFVGGLAFSENRDDLIEKTKRDVKATNIDTIILLMTGIAYSLYDPNKPIKTESIALGTLLPTEEYWYDGEDKAGNVLPDDYLVKEFEKRLQKEYTVKFHSPVFKNAEITIKIEDYDIVPEGVAGHMAVIYDEKGNTREGVKVENEVHLGIIIGSITTEVSVYNNGEFDPRGFVGIPLGTSDPLDKIIDSLGIDMTRHQVDYLLRNKKQLNVNMGGNTIDLTPRLNSEAEDKFGFFTKQVVNSLNKKLSRQGIKTNLVTRINLGGGGAITTADSFKKEFNHGNIVLANDPRFANALGALYSIRTKRGTTAEAEVLDTVQEIASDKITK